MTDTVSTDADAPDAPPPNPNDVHLTINGKAVVAQKGEMIIKAADDNDEYIPRFCYYNRMDPVGMCRMCLCEVDSGRGPQLVATCMVPVAPDMKVEVNSPTSKRAQEGMIELLLANHPLDCPVCDKGGECPLQDQSFSHGPGESRYVEEKRHFEKPIPISDLVFLDRERCILCDRCTRFADEVAGDALIHFTHRGNSTQVNTFPDEPFSSYFSGNTVQICPVGALTAKPYRFKARPWDLAEIESTCTTCSVGCRIVVQSSRDEVVRYLGVDSEPVNWSWLCDKGRFGYEATNSPDRLTVPLVRTDDELSPTTWNEGLAAAAALINEAIAAGGPSSVAVLGGANGTNEDAFAWAQLATQVIGTPNVYPQFGDGLPAAVLALPRATITETVAASTIVLLGPDLKEELGVLYLRLRDAVVRGHKRIIELTPKQTGLSRYAWRSIGYEPGTQVAAMSQTLADADVAAQLSSGPVVVVVGRANLAESAEFTVAALDLLLARYPDAKVLPAFRRGNVVGALQVGMQPGEGGKHTLGMLEDAVAGRLQCLVLLGADPLRDHPDSDLTRQAMASVPRIIAIDTFLSDSSRLAQVVLPAAAAGEKSGSHTNIEGRVSRVSQRVTPRGTARPDWMIAVELGMELGTDLGYATVEEITDAIAASVPAHAGITAEALAAHPDGIIAAPPTRHGPIATSGLVAPDRNSYDFRLVVGRKMFDRGVNTTRSPSLTPLAVPATVHVHPLDLERIGARDGAEVKVSGVRGTLVLAVSPDPTVLRGTAWVPFNQPGANVGDLIDCTAPVIDVRIETL
ncbi:MAG: nuoG [Ilumatobacteraceae bacterium]|nr:nuoG [Ilumatobacteraceae bacterium]